uniref:NADH-ubiquinone oxidoreductase chain 2 n=1 Tax=Myrmoplasta mira TaxID=2653830 RepID=A0A5P8DK32_9HEMI|nr:NADH dehydrogenase subunit 2 [Myrmoplasta mira]
MNVKKILIFSILILSTLITMSSNNWLSMWMGLEMNLMSFIPLIKMNKNKKTAQSMMIYFLTQSIGSIIMLFAILMNSFINYNIMEMIPQSLLTISLMIKMAGAPFHFWLPEMMTNMSWMNCFILMTWQKLAPLTILSNIINNNILIFILSSAMVGAIGGLNLTSLRKIMAYSSINHLSWMMMMMVMEKTWYNYMLMYMIIMAMLAIMLKEKNIYFTNQLILHKMSTMEKITISSLMMSMGGMPPFFGFIPKWLTIQNMTNSNMWMLMLFMILLSLITLFYYIRMMYPSLLIFNTKIKWTNMKLKNNMATMMMSTNLLMPMIIMLPLF